MANDGQIVFEVTADGKHAIADIKDITKAIQQETKKWDASAGQATDSIENKFSGMLKKLVAGFSAVKIGKALLDLGKDAIAAASDLEEVQNVVDVTFGESSNKIEKWAKAAGEQFGLTETQAKRFTSTLGAMMKSAGMSGDKIADISTDLAGLTADMASFYNLDFDTAFQKIRSGLSGETEPLKQLGINMSVANLNAFALQQGLSKTFDQMDQGEQTMLRYQYLMQATSDAQGDFSRTSDGYANSLRKMQTNIEQLKTTLGRSFIEVITQATGAINSFIEGLMPDESKRTVLDDFADIDLRTSEKLQDIQAIRREAEDTASVLREIYGNGAESEQGAEAAEIIGKFGVNSAEAQEYLQGLGFSTEEINSKQQDWLETCKRLVDIIPGLSSIINTETGEVKGGTQAVYDYIKAWEEGQTKLAMLGALEQKESALASRFSDLPGLQLDKALAEKRVRDNFKQLRDLYKKYGVDLGFDENGKIVRDFNSYGLQSDQIDRLNKETDYYEALVANMNNASEAYQRQADALEEAKVALEEYRKTIDEMPGDVEQAATTVDQFWIDNADNIKLVVNAADEALKALQDYAQGVHEATTEAVNSVVHGLERVDYQKYGKQIEKITELTQKQAKEKVGSDEWKKLDEEIRKANESLKSTSNIYKNLESQSQFLSDYLDNVRKAREMGLDDNLLAELSDGSVESAEYLDAIVKDTQDGVGVSIDEINKKYREIQDQKAALSKELANQQLTVDQTYQALADKAKEAVAALDLQGEAAANAGATVAGIAQGIGDHVSDVAAQVDAIISQLERLNGYGIDIDFGGFGKISFTTSTGKTDGSGRMGIPLVPHDDYIARLHEGERVLTAQENQIWNALRNGGVSGFDLETLGGVMRDNVKPGGNVYLDGRVVGSVISDQQGKSYRQLQRSGWQS
jgi:hypothetical protein